MRAEPTTAVERVPTEAERKLVTLLAAVGVPETQIAKAQGMTPAELRRRFDRELASGNLKANRAVAESLFQAAIRGNVAAQTFWLRTRGGWTENPPGGEDGNARLPKLIIELRDPTRAERTTKAQVEDYAPAPPKVPNSGEAER